MTTYKFQPGDRVVYTGKSTEWVNKERIGLMADVTGQTGRDNVRIRFDGWIKDVGVYPDNLEIIDTAYDPTQAGDRDDDL